MISPSREQRLDVREDHHLIAEGIIEKFDTPFRILMSLPAGSGLGSCFSAGRQRRANETFGNGYREFMKPTGRINPEGFLTGEETGLVVIFNARQRKLLTCSFCNIGQENNCRNAYLGQL